jgi:hypothetical protein
MSEPAMTCTLCGRRQVVRPDGRGFPPDIAKRKLRKLCNAAGCRCDPVYRAGIDPRIESLLGEEGSDG